MFIKSLIRSLLHIPPVRVIGLEDMTECDQRDIFHFHRVMLHTLAVFDHFYRIVVLTLFGNRILVMQIPAQISVTRHGIQPDGKVLRTQTASQILYVLQPTVIKRTETAPTERTVHTIVRARVTAPYTSAEEFSGRVRVMSHRIQIFHLYT